MAQNINRALAGTLRAKLNDFLAVFWRIGAIESIAEFEKEFAGLEEQWHQARWYIPFLKYKKEKWAFTYTHQYFVAGISSTQRQEQVNCQIKTALVSNSSLQRILDGFECVEKSTAERLIKATVATKLATHTDDPIIHVALRELTLYAASLLKEECSLSLSYSCVGLPNPNLFRVSHKDAPESKYRMVEFDRQTPLEVRSSCRKSIWHGIVCRHILTVLRNQNHLSCPIELFNSRWRRDYADGSRLNAMVDRAIGLQSSSITGIVQKEPSSNSSLRRRSYIGPGGHFERFDIAFLL